ncbi:hypothetical protein VC83_06277 [Pseudogymnoascus destructans]|uniref:RRM domain-containing protein n=2 Tax=Pseudogymnoascus destructans TaxID=655981 RepID=L8GBZ0_PSED2|nr:uncharacterized protein VC83_06277 [Pseudogymnoascus destructans]ELR10730.1 hypothetical protein GMDG_04988 [Pseudogymnoascus destructans 20631-21]OAF58936.1 hypothetical protein VC83_06277 [Pseudogymnoascus destructans]
MSSTKEVKIKKEKLGKKSKSADKIDVPAPVETSEDVVPEDAPEEVKPKKDKKEKKEKKEKEDKSEKSSKKRRSTTEEEPIADSTPKKSKRTRSTEDDAAPTKSASPQPAAMEVDNDETEPPSKKRKSTTTVDGEELEIDVTKPQPPSKKDLRRLKKGKSLSKAKTVSDVKPAPAPKADGEEGAEGSGAEDAAAAAQKPEQEKRSEHGIWVGNLPWSVSKEDLKSFLINQGPMPEEAITRIHMPSPDDKKPANKVESRFTRTQHNKGFAYVDFTTAEHTLAAVALSEELLGGRRVLIKNNKSFEGRPLVAKDAAAKKETKAPSKRVFLGNLRFDTTEESLKEHFERCGPIETCMVATFEDSGKCKGYAWITFADLEASARAVRGFVLEEEDNSDADTDSEERSLDEDPEDYAEAATKSKKEKRKVPMKRVYVNMIQRRPVRIEFAEDAQVRYKKRYGAGGTKNPVNADGEVEKKEKKEKVVSGVIVPSKKAQGIEYRTEYAPRLTGGIVESKGTKVAFD